MRVLAALCLLCACDIDLPVEGTLDRTRVLAAQAEPAQPAVGEGLTVTSYAWAPSGTPTVVWCVPPGDCDPTDPLVDRLRALDWAALDDDERMAQREQARSVGILGMEPGMPVQAVAMAVPGAAGLVLWAYGVPLQGDDIEEATLTIPLATDGPPNRHPRISSLLADAEPVTRLDLRVGQMVTLEVAPMKGSLETYVQDGESRAEEPSIRWYTDAPESDVQMGPGGGGGGPAFLDDGTLELVVDQPFEGIVAAVLRDGRGGVDWLEIPLSVTP